MCVCVCVEKIIIHTQRGEREKEREREKEKKRERYESRREEKGEGEGKFLKLTSCDGKRANRSPRAVSQRPYGARVLLPGPLQCLQVPLPLSLLRGQLCLLVRVAGGLGEEAVLLDLLP